MTLEDLTLPISYADASQYALVFGDAMRLRLVELQQQHGTTNCWPVVAAMTDGRFLLSAEVLTECGPGGLLHAMWEAADKAVLLPNVEVIPWADAVALLPSE